MTALKPIKHFTHTDLDGVGCAIVSNLAFNEENVSNEYCEYNNIDKRISQFLDSGQYKDYSFILITDISVTPEVAAKLDHYYQNTDIDIALLDHHKTALWLNEYDWAYVYAEYFDEEENRMAKSSGTSMLYEFFVNTMEMQVPESLSHFVELVRRYDTWEWDTHYKQNMPKQLNDYLSILGLHKFFETMIEVVATNKAGQEIYFDDKAQALLEQREIEIDRYINQKDNQMKRVFFGVDDNDNDRYYGLVFAENHASVLGNELCNRNIDIEYIMIVNIARGSISFRTIRDDVDLSEVAKEFGGGGHPKAAGASIPSEWIDEFIFKLTH